MRPSEVWIGRSGWRSATPSASGATTWRWPSVGGRTDLRIGQGYDSHRFAEGRRLVLGGIEIPFDRGLSGHSDADVLAHAVTDAVLGAAGLGDIGRHFPPDDAAWKDADSIQLLRRVVGLLEREGYQVVNVDATLISERPRIGPYADRMSERLAGALGIAPAAVSVKATTNEGMGWIGREEGMAALAVALVDRIADLSVLYETHAPRGRR